MQNNHNWAVVLAAGDGKRLAALTADRDGQHVPKQFCSLHGGASLLDFALERARALVREDQVCAVVSNDHEQWWLPIAEKLHTGNLIVQPRNRGTGNGVLLALLAILKRDPLARIIFLPADHHVMDEEVLTQAMQSALLNMATKSHEIFLLGIEPDDADPDLGYVVPQDTSRRGVYGVRHFVEKPSRGVAGKLIKDGGLWNSGIFAANGAPLLALFKLRFPGNAISMETAVAKASDLVHPSWALGHLYARLSEVDFSHHILQSCVNELRVVRVPSCGWSDLGTPNRVSDRLNLLSAASFRPKEQRVESAFLSLAEAIDKADRRCISLVIH